MRKPLYILKSGRIRRKENTLFFEPSSNDDSNVKRKVLPVETIDSIFVFSEVDLNAKVLNFLAQENIPVHFFNYYGYYTGSFYPREYALSGKIVVKQVEFYLDKELRFEIASEIVSSACHNMLKNLKYYQSRYGGMEGVIEKMESLIASRPDNLKELMGYEGQARKIYYSAWDFIVKVENEIFKFDERTKRPPENPINALISFGNSVLYGMVLTEIYKTQLNPGVSYLHEPSTRRFSLSLDISEIFKPVLVDRVIFSLINHRRIRAEHFNVDLNYAYLKDSGKKVFLSEFEDKLETTIKHITLKRSVSYRGLIRLECFKLIKHLLGEDKYRGFKIWW